MLHHLAPPQDSPFCQVHQNPSEAGKEAQYAAKIQSDQTKLSNNQLKKRVDSVLDQAISFRISQNKLCKELGFDNSRETFIRGENSIVIMLEITAEYLMVIFFEMNPLKVEFFDCDQYLYTIDDLVQNLLEVFID